MQMQRWWILSITLLFSGLVVPAADSDGASEAVPAARPRASSDAPALDPETRARLDELDHKAQALSQKLARLEAERQALDQERAAIESLRRRLGDRLPEMASARAATP